MGTGNVKMGYQRVVSAGSVLTAGGTGSDSVTCPGTKYVLSGGCYTNGGGYLTLLMTYPSGDQTWVCSYINTSGSNYTMYTYAICANIR